MNDSAYEQLVERLGGSDGPAAAVADVVLAAADGVESLASHLAGAPVAMRRDVAAAVSGATPARVYLDQIAVENFRGIAQTARLQLVPGPGLTLVVGRNGSGKSSFAEGLEMLLTGTNLRWEDRTRVWRDGWRNLHGDGPAVLSARFRVDGEQQPLELRRRWAPDAPLDGGDPIEVSGARTSWDATGWNAALSQFRPLLSYNELGTMFSERAAALYEALSAVLGLEEFDALAATLRTTRLDREKSGKLEKTERKALLETIDSAEGDRAAAIAPLLAKTRPDVDAIETAATTAFDTGDDAGLQALAGLELPTVDQVDVAFDHLAATTDSVRQLEATDADRLDALARLLDEALQFHQHHGTESCPVCGTAGVLDAGWVIRSEAEVEELRRRSQDLRGARGAARAAQATVDALFPASLGATEDAALRQAWTRWTTAAREDDARDTAHAVLIAAGSARETARQETERRQVAWRPIQTEVTAWVALARRAAHDKDTVAILKDAEAWMAGFSSALRRERLLPIVEAAQANWAELRHESNVALGEVELRKEGTRRYAAFDVTVDGSAASAFGVMSQGELSALAVSIFVPRASLAESPFGFMVIDDPVQSMDPAKVDGLARVLARAAETRQVIVFTHDERLPEAVRRLDIDARIMTVQRRAASRVEVVAGRPPSDRYVGEALAFAKTEDVSDEVRARVVPGLCRSAIEAACAALIRRRLIESGVPHAEVERVLAAKTSLNSWLAEAFELSIAQGAEITDRVRRLGGEDAVVTVATVKRASHRLHAVDGQTLAEGTRGLVRALEAA